MVPDNLTEDDVRYFREKYQRDLRYGDGFAEKARRQLEMAEEAYKIFKQKGNLNESSSME